MQNYEYNNKTYEVWMTDYISIYYYFFNLLEPNIFLPLGSHTSPHTYTHLRTLNNKKLHCSIHDSCFTLILFFLIKWWKNIDAIFIPYNSFFQNTVFHLLIWKTIRPDILIFYVYNIQKIVLCFFYLNYFLLTKYFKNIFTFIYLK